MRTIVNLAVGIPCLGLLVILGFWYAMGFMIYMALSYGLWIAWLEGRHPKEYKAWVKEMSGKEERDGGDDAGGLGNP
jgi:hypothetical protein